MTGEYGLQFERIDHPGSGYVLPCDSAGLLDFDRFRNHDWESCGEVYGPRARDFSTPVVVFYPNGGLTLPHIKDQS